MKLQPNRQPTPVESTEDEVKPQTEIELPYTLEDIDPVDLEKIFSQLKLLKFSESNPDLDAQIALKSKKIIERINLLINKSPKFKKDLQRIFTKLTDGVLTRDEIHEFSMGYLEKNTYIDFTEAWNKTIGEPGQDPVLLLFTMYFKIQMLLVAVVTSIIYATGRSFVKGDRGLGIEFVFDRGPDGKGLTLNTLAIFYIAKVLYFSVSEQESKNRLTEEA